MLSFIKHLINFLNIHTFHLYKSIFDVLFFFLRMKLTMNKNKKLNILK